MLVLGLDPGSRVAGYAAVAHRGLRIVRTEIGAWTLGRGGSRAERLGRLVRALEALLERSEPDVAAVEGLFQHRNPRSALALAEARGALLATLGRAEVPVLEYSPAAVKKTVCGNGSATKEMVRRALGRTVPSLGPVKLDGAPPDATDALAIAVCHVTHRGFGERVSGGRW
jgi:crossover junction endodeoxyribonuclease RuvC